ncbi:hypothetical protein LTR22_026570 [Elasticomyces elasticus]|nr:hypothetical protein LTR22_026570 [Elasticomyces elasticus]
MSDWVGLNINSCANFGECTLTPVSTPASIDTAGCLYGLQGTRKTYASDSSWWRCIANVTDDINSGGTGQWSRPILTNGQQNSYTLGLGLPTNSGDYSVDTTQPYVLYTNDDGDSFYEPLTEEYQDQLSAADLMCTGSNSTEGSTVYYARQDALMSFSTSGSTGQDTPTSTNSLDPYADAVSATSSAERDEVRRCRKALFNLKIRHPSKFMHIARKQYLISVKLKGDMNLPNVGKIMPSPNSSILVLLASVSVAGDPANHLHGTMATMTPAGCDFAVLADLSREVQDDEAFELQLDVIEPVHILWRGTNFDLERRMQAVREACVFGKQDSPSMPPETMSGHRHGLFCLRNIIPNQRHEYLSYPLLELFFQDHPTDTATSTASNTLQTTSALNTEQQRFITAALDGVLAATVLLEGLPGTGKRLTLAFFTMTRMMMGYSVLIVSQSNKGVDVLFIRTVEMLYQHNQRHLADRIVRVMSELSETALAQELEAQMSDGAGQLAVVKVPPATDPNLMKALASQAQKLKLLVLGGDTIQLGPFVLSLTSGKNSLGDVLAMPALQRIESAYADFTSVELVQNYRGHLSTLAMSSEVFYGGKVIAGGPVARWNPPEASQVHDMLSGPDFTNAFRERSSALADTEQEENSTSWYNPDGDDAVVAFIQMLVQCSFEASKIGIISMYGEDDRQIQQLLRHCGVNQPISISTTPALEVSTVDALQGREKESILVHFVAAFNGRLDPFGFVKKAQRLNVARTQSKQDQFLFANMDHLGRRENRIGHMPVPVADKIRELMRLVREKGQFMDWHRLASDARRRSD